MGNTWYNTTKVYATKMTGGELADCSDGPLRFGQELRGWHGLVSDYHYLGSTLPHFFQPWFNNPGLTWSVFRDVTFHLPSFGVSQLSLRQDSSDLPLTGFLVGDLSDGQR